MEHKQKGMERRWERHYPESRSTLASGMILFGVVIGVALGLVWPQVLSAQIFNSRLAYHLILDLEDYWTCDKDYIKFIVDEPTQSTAMYQFWLFNVSNAQDIIDRGFKPHVVEVGPYGFRKKTYKYDVYIDPVDSLYITYQEYTLLEEITDDPQACVEQYGRMDRHFLASRDYCKTGSCACRSINDTVTIFNPLFLKTINDESTHELIGQFSSAVFIKIKSLLENDFVAAVRAHLVSNALKEIYLFRNQMQLGIILNTMVESIMSTTGATVRDVADMFAANSTQHLPSSCGLSKYCYQDPNSAPVCIDDLSSPCPINGYTRYITAFKALLKTPEYQFRGFNLTASDYPSIHPLFDASVPYSLLNMTSGFSNWLGLAWQLGYVNFNGPEGFTLIKKGDLTPWYQSVVTGLCVESGRDVDDVICRITSKALILNVLTWLQPFYDASTSYGISMNKILTKMTYKEFLTTHDPVQCAPLGHACVWQWGYMRNQNNNVFPITDALVYLLIDSNALVDTNPAHIYFSKNAASYYNAHVYCSKVLDKDVDMTCADLNFCVQDGKYQVPSAFSGVNDTRDTSIIKDRVKSVVAFKLKSPDVQRVFVNAVCTMSSLMHSIYPTRTAFHEDYVIAFLNSPRTRDPKFVHVFSKNNWKEVGWAQFGSGVVTDLIVGVRAIYQVTRSAMWYFGPLDFYQNLIEFGSWSVKTGYPSSWIYDVDQSKALLYALSDITADGNAFRRNIAYVGTTLIGDGVNFENEVGAVGDFAFTPEANRGNFNCTGKFSQACRVLSSFLTSSHSMCMEVEDIYDKCKIQQFSNNYWASNCDTFRTSLSGGNVLCDQFVVYNKPHPYTKSRGNIVYEMLRSMTNNLRLKTGLWCSNPFSCKYDWGGFVTTTRVRNVLFEGYSEPSVLQFLNLKHTNDGISVSCRRSVIVDPCASTASSARESFLCDYSGLMLTLPAGNSKILCFGQTPNDEYFAPYFEVVAASGEMIWPYAMDPAKVRHAAAVRASGAKVVRMQNPNWAAYPALNTPDVEFNKFYQCQKRFYGGAPFKFNSCVNRLNTGRTDISKTMDLQVFQGNTSIYWFDTPAVVNGSFNQNQAPMALWDGFFGYPYIYNATQNGTRHREMKNPRIFHKTHPFNFVLAETDFFYEWEYNIDFAVPVCTTYEPCPVGRSKVFRVRRFEETAATWQGLKTLGTPKDLYGMPYEIPIGMASLERLAGFPLYAGTPHAYGNKLWGGQEYGHVQGYEPKQVNQRTFIDYDPVTGKIYRNVVRQSVRLPRLVYPLLCVYRPILICQSHPPPSLPPSSLYPSLVLSLSLLPPPSLFPSLSLCRARSTCATRPARCTPTSLAARAAAWPRPSPSPPTRATAASPTRRYCGTRTAKWSRRRSSSELTTTSTAARTAPSCCRPSARPSASASSPRAWQSSSTRPTTAGNSSAASTLTDFIFSFCLFPDMTHTDTHRFAIY